MKWLWILIIFVLMAGSVAKISYAADEERFVFSDLSATDKKTGLTWTRDANIAETDMTWEDAYKFIEKLNKQKYAGHSDWRLPTKKEFQTLLAYAESQGYTTRLNELFNKIGFINVQAGHYWSSSTFAYPTHMWYGNMNIGDVSGVSKTDTIYVWPVRGGK